MGFLWEDELEWVFYGRPPSPSLIGADVPFNRDILVLMFGVSVSSSIGPPPPSPSPACVLPGDQFKRRGHTSSQS